MSTLERFERWWFRYFSQETLEVEEDVWVRWTFAGFFLWTGLGGVFFDLIGEPKPSKAMFIIYSLELLIFGLTWIFVWFYHNWRIKHENDDKL